MKKQRVKSQRSHSVKPTATDQTKASTRQVPVEYTDQYAVNQSVSAKKPNSTIDPTITTSTYPSLSAVPIKVTVRTAPNNSKDKEPRAQSAVNRRT